MIERVVVIGWDSATWDYIDPMLEAGELPALAGLLRRGVRATLRSTIPPFTSVAWPSLVTGLAPGKTGTFGEAKRRSGSYRRIPNNLCRYHGIPIWHWLNRFDRRAGVLNVPTTYPATSLDGYMVSGFDSPLDAGDVAWPATLLDRWAEAGHPYTILHEETALMDTQNPLQGRGELKAFVQGWEQLTEEQGAFVAWVWEHDPVDILFVVFSGTDSINHRTRDMALIRRVYRAADRALGRIVETVGDDTAVCLVSDHGSTPAYRYIALYRILHDADWMAFNPWLAAKHLRRLPAPLSGWFSLLWQRLPEPARRLLSWPLLRIEPRLCESYDNIDWEHTRVYARANIGPLYLNLRGREPTGAVTPDEYEKLRAVVAEHLLALRDPDGRPLFARVMRREEIYPNADPKDDPPDLIFQPARWSDHVITGYSTDPIVRDIPDEREYGTHTPDGIFVLASPGVRASADLGTAQIVDVLPTLLAAWQVPIPEETDGNVLQAAFATPLEPEFLPSTPVEEKATEVPTSDSEEMLDRLRALGYLD